MGGGRRGVYIKSAILTYSIRAWIVDPVFRCLVQLACSEGEIHQCDFNKCEETRKVAIKNNQPFTCKHIEKVVLSLEKNEVLKPIQTYSREEIENKIHDKIPANIRIEIQKYLSSQQDFLLIKLDLNCFLLRTPPGNFSAFAFVHIYHEKQTDGFRCAIGGNCRRETVIISKKTVSKTKCIHERIVNLLNQPPVESVDEERQEENSKPSSKTEKIMENTSEFILRHKKISFSRDSKKEIENSILLQNQQGWPKYFEPNENSCPKCQGRLPPPTRHARVKTSHLLTRDDYTEVTVLVRQCEKCDILIQPSDPKLLNIGDSLIVTMDIIYLMMEFVHIGTPLSSIAEVLVENIGHRNFSLDKLSTAGKEWLQRLLYTGYIAAECLDVDDIESQICGLCGIIPEVTLGDGSEDVSCVIEGRHLDIDEEISDTLGEFPAQYVDEFKDRLKQFFIGGLVYPRLHMNRRFPMKYNTIPPFLLAPYRNHTVFNTEHEKQTRFTEAKNVRGNQSLLLHEIETGSVEISSLNKQNGKKLSDILLSIGFTNQECKKFPSNLAKIDAIMTLYHSIESGYSQCHHTGNRKKASGGWYHEICPHSCIIASKFLVFSESVRDVIDLKKSKKMNSPVSILDTPCTAAANLIARDPETAEIWFSGRRGCFEKPTLGKEPVITSLPKLKLETRMKEAVTLLDAENLLEHQDPKTGDQEKYFVGDRFHESTVRPIEPIEIFHGGLHSGPKLVSRF